MHNFSGQPPPLGAGEGSDAFSQGKYPWLAFSVSGDTWVTAGGRKHYNRKLFLLVVDTPTLDWVGLGFSNPCEFCCFQGSCDY